MNEGKIWTVVSPNHGVPLFLGAVALIALTVHFAILNHTTWFSAYWQGAAPAAVTSAAPMTETAPAAATPTAAPVSATP